MVLLHGDKFHWLRHREPAGIRSETRCRRRPLLEQMEPRALLSSVMGISAGGSVADVGLVTPRATLVAARSPLVDQTSSTVTITAQPNQDAAAFINFDLKADPNIQQPDYHVLDLNQGYPGPSVRLAPPGTRDDSLRPVPGVIEETRTVIELNLAQLQGIDPTRIESVMLNVNVNDIRMTLPDGTVVPLTSGVFLVRGFDGDGTPTIDDFGSINATSPDLGFAFNPPPMTDLGVVNISSFSAGPITTNLDITGFVRDLVSRGVPYAGINLKMDYGSLPPRTSLSGDTTFAIDTISADALGGQYAPNLVVTVAPISTQTEVVSSLNPSAFGGNVTFTATVKPNSGTATPTGTVEFLDGGSVIGTGNLDPTGTATFTTSSLSVGDHPITAHYLGVKDYAESTSAIVSQVVNKAQATLCFDPATLTQTYSGTARVVTVTTSPAALAGVTLTYNGATTAPVNAGSYTLVASLNNPNYTAAPITGTLTVNKADQSIQWSTPAAIGYGTALSATQLNATVTGVPGGSAPGALAYTPVAGTILPAGMDQALTVTAAGTTNYNPATFKVYINVLTAQQQDNNLIQEVNALVPVPLRPIQAQFLKSLLTLTANKTVNIANVNAFIFFVRVDQVVGILTPAQANPLIQGADMLLVTLSRS